MATKIEIKGNIFIVEDTLTRIRYTAKPVNSVTPLRIERGGVDYFSFPNNSPTINNYDIGQLNMNGKNPSSVPGQQVENYEVIFTDIVDSNGIAIGDPGAQWATVDELDEWLCTNLGGTSTPISTKNSIESDNGSLQLVGDAATPGIDLYYGTDAVGNKGFHTLATIPYFKDTVVITTSSANFNSNAPVDIPGMTYNITIDGDYIVYAVVNLKDDQNEEFELYYAVNAVTNTNEPVWRRFQKKQDDSIQATWSIDGLTNGDIITIQGNTRGDNVDLEFRRIILQSWG